VAARSLLIIGVAAAAVTAAVTPLAAALARRFALVDRPGPLKVQRAPVPYLGGAAVTAGVAVGLGAAGRWALALPPLLALGLGIADDRHDLPARGRLAGQVLVGVTAGAAVPGGVAARTATTALVVVLINAWNLVDGLDGLAAGVTVASGAAAATLGGDAAPVAAATAGAAAGFLVWNRPPARIYLGDGGAYLLGTVLALTPALAGRPQPWSVWLVTPMLFGVPVADVGVAVIRRARAGAPLFAGDRSHSYDQLADRGLPVGRVALLFTGAQALLGVAGALGARAAPPWALTVSAAGTATVFAACLRAGLFSPRGSRPAR
jgi:UDP-GlcNAc:undecaprenyl-phosphate GlcNAc-1-phosphate transferase